MTKVKEIELVLENCEYITLPTKHIGVFELGKIEKTIGRINMDTVEKEYWAKDIYIEVIKPELIKVSSFIVEPEEPEDCLKRMLRYDDITYVVVKYEDDSVESYSVDWDDSNESVNYYQETELAKNGNLHISINRNKSIKDRYEEEEYEYIMNNKEDDEWGYWE